MQKENNIKFDEERLNYWLGVGAQMSSRVKKITGK
jgi:small subunit ribosomal protein S16